MILGLSFQDDQIVPWQRWFLGILLKGIVLSLVGMALITTIYLSCKLLPSLKGLEGTKAIPAEIIATGQFLPFESFPPDLAPAVLFMEDPGFYSHWGVDPRSIQQALKLNLNQHTIVYGGSSISQQLARTLFLNTEKNLVRKFLELLTAFVLERSLTKQRILELYLNYIPLGLGINGFADAADAWFNSPIDKLSIPEKVALLSIMPSPFHFTPTNYQTSPTLEKRSKEVHRFYRQYFSPAKRGLVEPAPKPPPGPSPKP